MVRYNREHKQQTRAAIVRAASKAFRARGIEQVGVSDVMADAGLTHGGFYAHFTSKEDLVAEACAHSLLEAAGRSFGPQGHSSKRRSLSAYLQSYLSRAHRDDAETGCAIASLAGDIARRSPKTRRQFSQAVQEYAAGLETLLPEDTEEDDAWALLAGIAGTLMLSRAVDDPELSDRILLSGRRFFERAFAVQSAPAPVQSDR